MDLDKLPCSEKVNQLDDIAQNWHSTPKMSNEIDFDKVLVENESYLSLLAFFDRSLKQHESLLNKAICLSNSSKGKSDLRKRSTGGMELPLIEIDESTNVLECSNVVEELQMQENTVVDVINDNYVQSQVLNETENLDCTREVEDKTSQDETVISVGESGLRVGSVGGVQVVPTSQVVQIDSCSSVEQSVSFEGFIKDSEIKVKSQLLLREMKDIVSESRRKVGDGVEILDLRQSEI